MIARKTNQISPWLDCLVIVCALNLIRANYHKADDFITMCESCIALGALPQNTQTLTIVVLPNSTTPKQYLSTCVYSLLVFLLRVQLNKKRTTEFDWTCLKLFPFMLSNCINWCFDCNVKSFCYHWNETTSADSIIRSYYVEVNVKAFSASKRFRERSRVIEVWKYSMELTKL